MKVPVLANQQELTYISSGCRLEDLPGAMNVRDKMEREGQGNSYYQHDLIRQIDDDNIYKKFWWY